MYYYDRKKVANRMRVVLYLLAANALLSVIFVRSRYSKKPQLIFNNQYATPYLNPCTADTVKTALN